MDYVCSECGRKLLEVDEATTATIRTHCKACGATREAVPGGDILHRSYRCTGCGMTLHAECREPDWSFCAACGTETLEVVQEVRSTKVAREWVPA